MIVPSPSPRTRAALREGAAQTLPFLPGLVVFALALGQAAARAGYSTAETALMSALVFAGNAQLLVVEKWTVGAGPAALGSAALLTGIVNLRFVVMGASLSPGLAPAPRRLAYPGLALLTDVNFALASRGVEDGAPRAARLLGSGLVLYGAWTLATPLGQALGALVTNPRAWGLDLVGGLVFAVFAAPAFRARRDALVLGAAALASAAVWRLVPGPWFIVAGALAGALAAALLREGEEA